MSQRKSYRAVTGEEVKWYQNKNGKLIKDKMRRDEIIYDCNKQNYDWMVKEMRRLED